MNETELKLEERNYDAFWDFIVNMRSEIEKSYHEDPQVIGTMIGGILDSVAPELGFEFGLHSDGHYELILIAEGISDNIDIVLGVYKAAPVLDGWVVVPFRPAQELCLIEMPDRSYDPSDFYYMSEAANGYTHLDIYIKDYSDERETELASMAYMFLDTSLGEFEVMTKIGEVQMMALPQRPEDLGLKPLSALFQEIIQRYPPNA